MVEYSTPVSVTEVLPVTALVVTVKEALVSPSGIVTELGTDADEEPDDS